MVMPGFGPGIARAAAVVPVVLIVVFLGMLWLAGLALGDKRRAYVEVISEQGMRVVEVFLGGSPGKRGRAIAKGRSGC
jgi:hypothetical protein